MCRYFVSLRVNVKLLVWYYGFWNVLFFNMNYVSEWWMNVKMGKKNILGIVLMIFNFIEFVLSNLFWFWVVLNGFFFRF